MLFNYCCQLEFHKKLAIESLTDYLSHQKTTKYNKYDSVWLYVLIHLSNNWRHGTVLSQLPRLDLSRTRVCDLNWLKDNNLTKEEAKDIVYQLGRYIINIGKTGAEGNFRISEALEIPFATAAVLCELRAKYSLVQTDDLLFIGSDKTVNSKVEGSFFSNYPDSSFIFENRKMNRTLTTFIWSIIRHNSKNHPDDALTSSQFSRDHLTDNTTNIYIKLSQEQIDTLTHQLFARDSFGFVYKIFSDLLFGESENREDETKRIQAINKNFGNVYKTEATVGFINRISQERQQVEQWLLQKDKAELWEDYYALLTNQMPSKSKHYQCIKKECVFPELDCHQCSISIPNIYALSNLLGSYIVQIENLVLFSDLPEGEKKRQANQLFFLMDAIGHARSHFGDEVVYSFVEGGKARLKDLQGLLPSKNVVSNYRTV